MITKIETTQTIHTMGETPEAMMDDWCSFLETELSEQYPEATITVKQNNRISCDILYVECDLDEDGAPTDVDAESDVQEFINRCWYKWC